MVRCIARNPAWILAAIVALVLGPVAWSQVDDEADSAGASPSPSESSQVELTPEEQREAQVVARFVELIETNPRRGTALDRIYGHHVERGTLDAFVESFRRRAAGDPADGVAAMLLGLFESQRGNDAAAVAAFRDAESRLADNPLAPFYLGQSLVLVGQTDEAAAAFERAIGRKPPRAEMLEIFQALGRVYQRAQRHDEALAVWDRLEKLFPNDDRVREEIATALADEGRHAEALPRFESLASTVKDPYRKVAMRIEAAQLKLLVGRRDEALGDFETLLGELEPESWVHRDVRRRIEEMFLANDDLAGLAAYYERWVEKNPEDVDAIARLGRTLAMQGRTPEAQPWFEKAIKLAPSNRSLRLTLIEQLVADKQFADAIGHYEALDKLDPNNPDTIRQWGRLILRDADQSDQERKTRAADVWRRLLSARPNDALVASQVADLLREAEAADEAIALYKRAIELAPGEPQYSEYLGEFLHSLKRPEEALAAWERIAKGDNRTAENLTRLSEVLAGFDYRDQAIQAIGDALALDPVDFDRRLAHAQLLYDAERYEVSLAQLDEATKLADSVEQRDAIQKSQIEIYQVSGKLAGLIEALNAELAAGTNATAERWLVLALYLEADRRRQEALAAVDKAIGLDEASLAALATSARLNEGEGRLAAAADAFRKLADLDRRFRTYHLAQVAKLEARLGRREQALAAGRDLIAAAPGNPEHYQFFADLCMQLGDVEQGLDALRRAVRVNPAEPRALGSLANALAANFRTDEAIELYWRVFDRSTDLDERLGTVSQLAEMYLRSNQLERLIERLGRIGREADRQRELAICVAQAFHAAGDYGSARTELERLLAEDSRDTQLLTQLTSLSEAEGDLDSAAKFQSRLNEFAPSEQGEARLATIYVQLGEVALAQEIWTRQSQGRDAHRVFEAIDNLLRHERHEQILPITAQLLRDNPQNWEALYREGVALAALKRTDEAVERFEQLRGLGVVDDEKSARVKARSRTARPAGVAAASTQPAPTPHDERNAAVRFIRVATGMEAEYYTSTVAPWAPGDYGQARIAALAWLYTFADGRGEPAPLLAELERLADQPDPSLRAAWDLYFLQTIRQEREGIYAAAKRLASGDSNDARLAYLNSLTMRFPLELARNVRPDATPENDGLPPLDDAEVDRMLAAVDRLEGQGSGLLSRGTTTMVLDELRRAGRDDDYKAIYNTAIQAADEPVAILNAMNLATRAGETQVLLALYDKLDAHAGQSARIPAQLDYRYWSSASQTIGKSADAGRNADVLPLLERYLLSTVRWNDASRQSRRRSPIQAQSGGYITVWSGGTQRGVRVTYPMPNSYLDEGAIAVLRNAYEAFSRNDLLSDLTARLRQLADDETGSAAMTHRLALADVLWWNDERESAAEELARAIALAPTDEFELRLDLAEMHRQLGAPEDALAVLDSIEPGDHQAMLRREGAALSLAVAIGNLDRARIAAERLFGLRLDSQTQVQLAGQMHELGMHELAEAVLGRARQRAGSQVSALLGLMGQYQKQGDSEAAVQIAHQVLRMASSTGGRMPGQSYDSDSARQQAVQVLARSGQLDTLIERAEAQLERSPGSIRTLRTLADYYRAQGDKERSLAVARRTIEASPEDPQLRFDFARELLSQGDAAGSIEHFAFAVDRRPTLLANRHWEIQQSFQQVDKLNDFAALYERIDLKKLRHSGAAMHLVQTLLAEDKTAEMGSRLLARVVEASPENQSHFFQQLDGEQVWRRKEVYELAVKSMMPSRQAAQNNPWLGMDRVSSIYGDGRIGLPFGGLLAAAGEQNRLPEILQRIDEALATAPDWSGGKALKAILDARAGRLEAARTALEPLLNDQARTVPVAALWFIAQELEGYDSLAEFSISLYERAVARESEGVSGLGFESTAARRLATLYQRAGRRDDARNLLLNAVRAQGDPSMSGSDPSYAAYRQVNMVNSAMTELVALGYPADAIRLYGETVAQPRLLADADRFGGAYLRQQLGELLDRTLETTDRATLARTIRDLTHRVEPASSDPETAPPALDMLLVVRPSAADRAAVTSIAQMSISAAADSPVVLTQIESEIAALVPTRPDDFSAPVAVVLVEFAKPDGPGRAAAIERLAAALESSPLEVLEPGVRPNARQREAAARQLPLWLAAREAWKQDSTRAAGDLLAARALAAAERQSDPWWAVAMYRELGQLAFDRGDRDESERHWERLLEFLLRDAAPRQAPMEGGPDARTTIVTVERFQQAAQVAKLAAEAGLGGLSLRAVHAGLAGGPPIQPSTDNPIGSSGGLVRGSVSSNSGVASRTNEIVSQALIELDALWREHDLPAAELYDVLAECCLPTSRPSEVFLYPQTVRTNEPSDRDFDSVGRMLARWSVAAGTADDLRARIEARKHEPLAELPTLVLLARLGLESGDGSLARDNLAALTALLERDASQTAAVLACHAAIHGLANEAATEESLALLIKATGNLASGDGNEPLSGLLLLLARHKTGAGDVVGAKVHLDAYLDLIEKESSRYDPNFRRYRLRESLPRVASEYLRAGDTAGVLEVMGRFADLPNERFYPVSGTPIVSGLSPRLRAIESPRRFEILRDWTMPEPNRRSVRMLALFVPEDAPPAAFASAADPPAPIAGFVLPGTSTAPGVWSSADLLIEAARESGRLDELATAVRSAAEEGIENAVALSIMVEVARGRSADVASVVRELTAEVSARIPEQSVQPFRWSDYLVALACLRTDDLAGDGLEILESLEEHGKRTRDSAFLPSIRRDRASYETRRRGVEKGDAFARPSLWRAGSQQYITPSSYRSLPTLWTTHEEFLCHLTGPGVDQLGFEYPLAGEFEFAIECSDAPWGDGRIAFGGYTANPAVARAEPIVTTDGTIHGAATVGVSSRGFNRYRIRSEADGVRYFVDGRLVHHEREPSPTHPWLALVAGGDQRTVYRNARLVGSPTIPREVPLAVGDRFEGWSAYYGESLLPRPYTPEEISAAHPDVARSMKAETDWRAESGVIHGRKASAATQPDVVQSAIMYWRPLLDGESFEYEFLYEPGEHEAHPTLGRVAFLIEPQGVRLHYMTSGAELEWTGLAEDNAVAVPGERRGPPELPLVAGDWNRIRMILDGDVARLELNGVEIYEHRLDPSGDRFFGLFHDRSKTAVQVRGAVLRGDWPESLSAEQLADLMALDPASPSDAATLATRHAVIGEEWLSGNADQVYNDAIALAAGERFDSLAEWVLPGIMHPTFRLQGAFTPTNPIPEAGPLPAGLRRVEVAGKRLVPAELLVAAAAELGRLDELASLIEAAPAATETERRGQLALLGLVRLAQSRDGEIAPLVEELSPLVKNVAPDDPQYLRWPELVLATACLERPTARPAAISLLNQLLDSRGDEKVTDTDWDLRLRHARGLGEYLSVAGADGSTIVGDPPLTQWARVTHGTPATRAAGLPLPLWYAAAGEVRHFPGHADDCLYFAVPLRGDFQVDCELRGNISLDYGRIQHQSPATETRSSVESWRRYRLVVAGGVYSAFVDDAAVHSQSRSADSDPWLAIRAPAGADCAVRNLTVSGGPTVPESLDLSNDPGLSAWLSDPYAEAQPGQPPAWMKRGDEIVAAREPSPPQYQWPPAKLVARESLLQYHRPFVEDGRIEYEFYYEPDAAIISPALDRLAFLVEPDGVKIHWLTDGYHERTDLAFDNTTVEVEHRRGGALPLEPNTWNRLALSVKGDTVSLELNGQAIYERPLESTNQRTFGLFRYTGQNESRVRRVTYRGNWPRELPPVERQELRAP